jgi:predicted flap endonuclease-1-like 5' DNA nuclease
MRVAKTLRLIERPNLNKTMTLGFLPFFTQLPVAIAISAIVFFILGWWLRSKQKKPATVNTELQFERNRTKALEEKVKEAKDRATAAEASIAQAQAEAKALLVGMVPQAEVNKVQSQLAEEQRKARDLSAQIQRSEDGFKALRNAEAKMIEVQNELSRSREEVARLKLAGSTPAAQLPDSEAARLKESMKTAETLAGNERRRANELEKEKTALQEQLDKAKEELATLKPLKSDSEVKAKAKLEADLAAAIAAKQATETALAEEKQRNAALDREFKLNKAQLSIARLESEKLKAAKDKPLSTAAAFTAAAETPAPAPVVEAPLEVSEPAPEVAPIAEAPIEVAEPTPAALEAELSTPVEAPAPAPTPEPAVPAKREKNEVATATLGKRVVQDDLKIIEGIGPKIEELLQADGITTWQKLSEATAEQIKGILTRAGERFVMHDPTTWPRQAALAHESKWEDLRTWQDQLDGGKLPEAVEP